MLNLGKQSLNISLIRNNCLSDRFISDQNLSFADMKTCCLSFTKGSLKGHRVTGYRNLSQYAFGNAKSFFRFLLEMGKSSPKKTLNREVF